MKIIIAPDSFKGSLTAEQAAKVMKRGVEQALSKTAISDYEVEMVPLSDGGEGFVQAVVTARNGEIVSVDTLDPLGRAITASYGLIDEQKTAIIEMSAASGIILVGDHRRPRYASTYGTGLLIRDALDRGCERIVVGLGGSATNDGGIGMAQALGYGIFNANGQPLDIFTRGLEKVSRIDATAVHPRLREVEFVAACDVEATLYGTQGATAIFGPQKGVLQTEIASFDAVLQSLANAIEQNLQIDVHQLKGGGAAGGIGAGLAAFCNAELKSGAELILEVTRFHDRLTDPKTALILTGEGQTDRQTALGKLPASLGKTAKTYGIPVFCISGSLGEGWEEVKKTGITACFSITSRPISLGEAIKHVEEWLEQTVCEVITAWTCLNR